MHAIKYLVAAAFCLTVASTTALAWTPLPVADDPLVRMPGTQPGQATLESPNRCLNCHAGYNSSVEPGFNWMGSMMAHAARDFLFYACMTVAAQDSIWAIGTPNAVDLCERCHFPKGWLEGRSDPPNASAMTGADFDGVQCDFCHQLWDPKFQAVHEDLSKDWDETNASATPSDTAAAATYLEDRDLARQIQRFNGNNFFEPDNQGNPVLPPPDYTESTSGQFFVSPGGQKRASFADADARHQMLYSRFHKSRDFCATCHDVSNPVLANLGLSGLPDDGSGLITEQHPAHSYFHVERTFSEFMLSAYGTDGGAATNPEFQAQGAPDVTWADKCQDCHMRDVIGVGANKRGVPIRPDDSVEHPNSGQPLHDLTGGNAWVPYVLASALAGSPNYDPTNDQLLNQGPQVLTLDLTQGDGLNAEALLAGVERAKQQLQLAATIKAVDYAPATGTLSFRIQNNSGHKLISGFPEGRRMFVNIKAYTGDNLMYEVNPYDQAAATLKGITYPYLGQGLADPQPMGANERYDDALVYEMHPSSTLTGESETFHFVLADGRYKDNRIPPKGFRIGDAAERLSVPVSHGTDNQDLFTSDEYAGGYDDVSLTIPAGADRVEVGLYYQTTSREYVEFLRDEINGTGNSTLPASSYIAQTDPFFDQLKAWGDTIWQLWTHNRDVPGAAPILMASASVGTQPPACALTPPLLESAIPGHTQVALGWSAVAGAAHYNVYYDQAGKAQPVASAVPAVTYTDTGLTDGEEYCYKVSAADASCESGYSNILCAVPTNVGQSVEAGVSGTDMQVGYLTGKGKTKSFVAASVIPLGEAVIVRTRVSDGSDPIADALVEIAISGQEQGTLSSGPSGTDGWAETTWQTQAPNRKGAGGTTPGAYSATVSNVTASGYVWDGVATARSFALE
jgi:hypothetical protein